MATIKVNFCEPDCKEHIHITITSSKGVKTIVATKAELKALIQDEEEINKKIFGNLITFCRLSSAGTWAELKTQIEAANFQE